LNYKEDVMNNTKQGAPGVRELLAQAQRAAADRDPDKALHLFSECTREYLKRQLPFKAIAVSRRARTVLGSHPRVSALIIRTYRATGFMGDAREELGSAAEILRKNDLAFLAALDEEAFVDLLSIMELVTYRKGKTIMKRHDPGEDVFLVLHGSCEVVRDGSRLAVMKEGDVFGEIGFFGMASRSATVKTLEKSTLVRMPSGPLRDIQERHPCLRGVLENIYSARVLNKAGEDLGAPGHAGSLSGNIVTMSYEKGQEIPLHPVDSVAVLKHGIVEVDYDEPCLRTKRYLKPGSIISHRRSRALAGTDVVIMVTKAGYALTEETEDL